MAFVVKQRGKWAVDWTDQKGNRHRRIVGDGTDRKAAKEEAKLLEKQLAAAREDHRPMYLADTKRVIQEWRDQAVSALSITTQERYAVFARLWEEDLIHRQNVLRFYSLEAGHVESYRNKRLQEAAPKTVWNEMTALRTLCNWAHQRGYHQQNVARLVPKLGTGRKLPEKCPYHYTEGQRAAILTAAWGDPTRYLMFCLGFFAGCRTGGVAALRVQNVRLEGAQPTITVTEKGSKERTMAVHPQLLEAFRRCPPKDPALWFGPMTRRQQQDLSKELCGFIRRATGLQGVLARFHNCRHTFAITLLRQGVSLPVVSRLLGHADVATTMTYLRVEDPDKAAAIGTLPVVQLGPQAAPRAAEMPAAASQ